MYTSIAAFGGSSHLNNITESDHHNYHHLYHHHHHNDHHHHQDHGNYSSILGKRPLSSVTDVSQKKMMMMAPPNPSSASFTIAFNLNSTSEEVDDEFLMSNTPTPMGSFQTRAKRGCATHPRSIAERNRRNRISERIKKLQNQFFPHIDKQTSTAEVLEEAVEYVRSLHIELQKLTDARAKCKCVR